MVNKANPKVKRTQVGVRLPEEMWRRLRVVAVNRNTSAQALVEEALRLMLEELRKS